MSERVTWSDIDIVETVRQWRDEAQLSLINTELQAKRVEIMLRRELEAKDRGLDAHKQLITKLQLIIAQLERQLERAKRWVPESVLKEDADE